MRAKFCVDPNEDKIRINGPSGIDANKFRLERPGSLI